MTGVGITGFEGCFLTRRHGGAEKPAERRSYAFAVRLCNDTITAIKRAGTLYLYHQDQRVGYTTRTAPYLRQDGIAAWYEERKRYRAGPKMTQRRLDQYIT